MEPSLSLPSYQYDPEPGVALYLEHRPQWPAAEWEDPQEPPDRNSLSVRGVEPGQLRRLSPIPPPQTFPTVPELEEPAAQEEEEVFLEVAPPQLRETGGRKHRRRLPFISASALTKSRSSRSFDSGISNLLSDSGSPSPPLLVEEGRQEDELVEKNGAVTLLAAASPNASPLPSRSPVTPSKRASFHAYSGRAQGIYSVPAMLPRPPIPNPPNSPSYKVQSGSKPGFFSARRLSEHEQGAGLGRTLSPISVPQCPGVTKSPSPVYSSSSKSSPQLHGSPVLRPSYSLHSNESSSSPPKSPDTCSPISPAASPPVSRVSRRLLPETPAAAPIAKELPKTRAGGGVGVRKIAWQLVTSHDSLDSGVYSRSNTSDSARESISSSCYSRATSSPNPPSVTASPTLARHHSWRKSTGARLPELPSVPQEQTRRQSLPGAQQGEARLHSDSVEGLNLTPKRRAECAREVREEERWEEQRRRREDCDGVASSLEAGLEVPRLRELKSHSFPPPWGEEEQEQREGADERRRRWIYCRSYMSDCR